MFIVRDTDKDVFKWKYGEPGEWEKIGDDAAKIIYCNGTLIKHCDIHNNFWTWNGYGNNWNYLPMKIYK